MTEKASEDTQRKNDLPEYGKHSSLTYNTYLKVDELKQLQVCQSDPPHHDEPLFIVIHQAYELWFKLILHELDLVISLLNEDKLRKATFFMRRVVAIFRLLVNQIHILETMSPKDFLGFRHKLNPASGFQSTQFREIEFLCGLKDKRMMEHFKHDAMAYQWLNDRFQAPSLQDAFYAFLARQGFKLPVPESDSPERPEDDQFAEQRVMALKCIYEDTDNYRDLHDFSERLVDLDELICLWRFHHVTVVERVIGFKRGTGGSEGVGYLRSTLTKRCFPDLWKIRTVLSP